MIDHLAARGVDQHRARLQLGEHGGIDQVLRVRAQCEMHAEDVGAPRRVTGRGNQLDRDLALGAFDAELARVLLRQRTVLPVETPAPDDDVHPEPGGAADHLAADRPDPEQRQGRAVEPARLRVLLLVPDAGPQVRSVLRDTPIDRQHQRERQLGDRDRVLAGTVRDVDPASRGRGHVDRVVARAGPHDQREAPGVEHGLGHLRAAHDQHLGAAGPDRVHQPAVLQIGLVADVARRGFQAVDPALLEFVGDQYFHVCASLVISCRLPASRLVPGSSADSAVPGCCPTPGGRLAAGSGKLEAGSGKRTSKFHVRAARRAASARTRWTWAA